MGVTSENRPDYFEQGALAVCPLAVAQEQALFGYVTSQAVAAESLNEVDQFAVLPEASVQGRQPRRAVSC